MPSVMTWLRSSRVWVLLLTLPQAAMWSTVHGSGRNWMIAAHTLIALTFFLNLDLAALTNGRDPRLSLTRSRFSINTTHAELLRTIAVSVFIIVWLGLLFADVGLALFAAAAMLLILIRTDAANLQRGSSRLVLCELVIPATTLILPALLIGSWEWGRQLDVSVDGSVALTGLDAHTGAMGANLIGSAVTGALLLGTFILLCLIRDLDADESDGLTTTATLLGRDWAVLYALIWIGATISWSAYAVGSGWWLPGGWIIGAIIAVASLIVVWSLATHMHHRAATTWFIAAAVASVMMAARVANRPLSHAQEPTLSATPDSASPPQPPL